MVAYLSVLLSDVEVKPRMWIDQIDTGQLGLELDRLIKGVLRPAVMSERNSGHDECDDERCGSKHVCSHARLILRPSRSEQWIMLLTSLRKKNVLLVLSG